ncbi:glycosyltransferase WbuB [Polynucleobacter sinensis]|uniref:glycosyltransferase WbuB n=1 Tax=Polynucleobacter sinensis TaxID=1743157 RepID=UPI0009ED7C30|nr:glycosyltransferase WbuB [Polynucleobacter sinensis]
MRILIYCMNYSPEEVGVGKYVSEMTEWLASRGHDLKVVTTSPHYPEWKVRNGYNSRIYSYQSKAGVGIWRCPFFVPCNPSGIKRILYMTSFIFFSFPVMLWQVFWRPNVVWVVEPALICAPTALLVAKLVGAKTWLHVQDFEVDAAFDLGILRGALIYRWVLSAEHLILRSFERVSTISRRMLMLLDKKGVSGNRSLLFLNWANLEAVIENDASSIKLRNDLGISVGTTVALYSGSMGAKQGLLILAGAARLLRSEPSLKFVFCGDGVGRSELMANCVDLPNVMFLDFQPAELLGALLRMADIHLLPQRADVADLLMPSKLTGMLASGRPVVATAEINTELAEVVSMCGIVVSPGDVLAFSQAIADLMAEPSRRYKLGNIGRNYAEVNFSKDNILSKFEQDIIQLASE